jgi:2-aminoethylphosphonate transport system substrate-binding protein
MRTHRLPLAVTSIATVALTASTLAACGGTSTTGSHAGSSASAKTVTIYSADGLADWYKPEFAQFTKQTGISVNYVEAGSSEVVSRAEKERSNPQADVIVTLPPFIQQADKDGMLAKLSADTSTIPATSKAADGHWSALINNYLCFIRNRSATPAPATWADLVKPQYKSKLQYSTPGEAGDGTALLVLLMHQMGKQGALTYLKQLQANDVGPSSSTGDLQPKVSSGQLDVANGDVQMNQQSIQDDKSAFSVFFPAQPGQKPETVALPYDIALASNAPHSANGARLVAFLLSKDVQTTVSGKAFGFPVRDDVRPADANFATLNGLLQGVQVYYPDWDSISGQLDQDVSDYKSATGS